MRLTDLTIKHLPPPEKGQRIIFDDALKGFGIRLSQGGSKTWVIVQGKQRKLQSLGRYPQLGLGDARKRAVVALETPNPPTSIHTSKTFSEGSTGFLEARRKTTKPATIYMYELCLKKIPWIMPIADITRKDVFDYLKVYEGKPTTQNYAFATLRTFFNWCIEQEIIDHSPIQRAKVPNRLKSRDRVLTDDEIKAIWKSTDYKPYGHFIRCLLLTAQRKMEIYKVKEYTDIITFPDTKNGKAHTIPVTPLLKEHLSPFNINHWSTQKDRLDRLSGITGYRVHDLRRTAATKMAELGIDPMLIERILNHTPKGIAAVYNRYSYAKEMREALMLWEQEVRRIATA